MLEPNWSRFNRLHDMTVTEALNYLKTTINDSADAGIELAENTEDEYTLLFYDSGLEVFFDENTQFYTLKRHKLTICEMKATDEIEIVGSLHDLIIKNS